MTTFAIDLALIQGMKLKYETLLASEKAYNKTLIESAVKNKSSMPEHYWQKENMLSNKVRAINALLDIFMEEL